MMIVQLLVFTCAYALGAAEKLPHYNDINVTLRLAEIILDINALSMAEHVPGLNDTRRQYLDILYVLHSEAEAELSCFLPDYYKDYQKNINQSLPYAVANPESVIQLTNNTINEVIAHIHPIQEVLKSVLLSGLTDNLQIDKAVDEEIKSNGDKYVQAKHVYFAAGIFATELIKYNENYFTPSSEDFSAHHLIINGAEKLHLIVMALKNLYQVMRGHLLC